MSDDVLVKVDNVSKRFCRSLKRSLWYGLQDLGSELGGHRHGGGGGLPQSSADVDLRKDEFWAVKDVSFELRRGECIGLIGRNGAGKSTLLKMLNGLIKPDQGKIQMYGRVAALIELNAGFNPILTGRENIYINGQVLGLTKREIERKLDAIIDFAEIGEFLDTPVQNYSSGMKVRLGFAVAAQMEPDVLIIDEVLAVGDTGFRIKCLNRIQELLDHSAVIFVSHSMPLVARICTHTMVLQQGRNIHYSALIGDGIDVYHRAFEVSRPQMHGPGEVDIESVSIDNQPNDSLVSVDIGDPLTISVELRALQKSGRIGINFLVWNQDQRPVAALLTDEFEVFSWIASNEKLEVKCTIPSVFFAAGKHSVTINVIDVSASKVLVRYDNALSFNVRSRRSSSADILLPAQFSLSVCTDQRG